MNRFASVKADGGRCRFRAQGGYAHCYNHREDTREARAAAASRGVGPGGTAIPPTPRDLAGRWAPSSVSCRR